MLKLKLTLCFALIVLASLILVSWFTSELLLTHNIVEQLQFSSLSALLTVLSSIAVIGMLIEFKKPSYKKLIIATSSIVVIISLGKIINALLGSPLFLEKYFFYKNSEMLLYNNGIFSPFSAALYLLLNISIVGHYSKNIFIKYIKNSALFLTMMLSIILLLAYTEYVEDLFKATPLPPFLVALSVFLLGSLLQPIIKYDSFPLKYFAGSEPEKRLSRIFLPAAVILVLVVNAIESYLNLHGYRQMAPFLVMGLTMITVSIIVVMASNTIGKELAESKSLYERLFSNSTVGLYQTTPEGKVISANPTLLESLEYDSLEEMIKEGINKTTYVDPQNKVLFDSTLEEKGEVIDFKSEWFTNKGNIVTMLESARAARNENGDIIRYDGVVVDITEKNKTEKALAESEYSYYKLIQNLPYGFYRSTPEGKFIEVNDALVRMLGYNSKEELLAIDIKKDLYVNAEDRSIRITSKSEDKAYKVRKKDGTEIWVEDHGWYSYDEHKKIIMHEGISLDVTERILKEQELQQAKEKAEESDRLKSAFLTNMSHEIRTPMNSILGFSELLTNEELSQDKKEKYYEILHNNGKRLLNLIDDIIDISKIDAKQLTFNYSIFNLNRLLDNLQSQFEISPLNKNVTIKTFKFFDDTESFVHCDNTRLVQILSNLLENALKFTENGEIKIGYSVNDSTIKFFINDTGIGIPENDLNMIFDRFSQSGVNRQKAKEGTGLGLSISKGIVEAFGGTIWAESELHKGATFYFTIPNCFVKSPQIKSPEIGYQKIDIKKTLTVLIAEDEESNYYYLEAIFENYGYNLLHAVNGKKALDLLINHEVDIILMDINMPVMDGITSTLEIRKIDGDIPIIALTAYAMAEDKEKALAAGCNEFLTKPVKSEVLINIVNCYLEKKM